MTSNVGFHTPLSEICQLTLERQFNYKEGSECRFIPINDKIGIKTYRSKRERDFAFRGQRIGFKHKIAPRASTRFTLEGTASSYKYGYITRTVKTLTYDAFLDKKQNDKVFYESFLYLVKQLQNCGLSTGDLDQRNVGFLNKRLLCIDFGELSSYVNNNTSFLNSLRKSRKIAA